MACKEYKGGRDFETLEKFAKALLLGVCRSITEQSVKCGTKRDVEGESGPDLQP